MFGALFGDIVGSRFEWNNHKSKDFELLTKKCFPTDDSIMTLAIADALLSDDKNTALGKRAIESMQRIGRRYPDCGYGGNFYHWIFSDNPYPYNSWGNGSAMRVSFCGLVGKDLDEVHKLAKEVTEVSHNHEEGLKGAYAIAEAVFLAKEKKSIEEIREYITKNYYDINFTLDEIRDEYEFDVSCQGSVPQALEAFFESTSFEDAIRNAISIGGDSDTIAAMTGPIADAYYNHDENPYDLQIEEYLDDYLLGIKRDIENKMKR